MISELLLTCLKLRNIQYDCLYRNTKLSFPFPHIPASPSFIQGLAAQEQCHTT